MWSNIQTRSQQFHLDDEPATLVSMCPTHGGIGSVCMSYMESKTSSVITATPRLMPLLLDDNQLFNIQSKDQEQWVDDRELYVVEVRVRVRNLEIGNGKMEHGTRKVELGIGKKEVENRK